MEKKTTKLIALLLPLTLVLPGCLKTPPYIPKNLKPLTAKTSQETKIDQQVTVHHAPIDHGQAQELFGSYAQNLDHYKIMPIQLTIENHGLATWVLTDNNIQLTKLNLNDVSKKLLNAKNWRPPVIFFGGLMFAFPVSIGACLIIFSCMCPAFGCPCCLLAPLVYGVLLGGAAFITTSCIAAYDAFDKLNARHVIFNDLRQKRGSDNMVIKPGMRANILFYVQQDSLPGSYNLMLMDETNSDHKLVFTLSL